MLFLQLPRAAFQFRLIRDEGSVEAVLGTWLRIELQRQTFAHAGNVSTERDRTGITYL